MIKYADLEISADEFFIYASSEPFTKFSFVRKTDGGWAVFSEKGKKLSKVYKSKSEAVKRLKQIEFFKNKKASAESINLKDCDDFSYSSVLRELRKHSPEHVRNFQKLFKQYFDEAISKGEEKADKVALISSLADLGESHPIDIDESFIKNASAIELGNPQYAGKYLSDIVKFVMQRISPENRVQSLHRLKNKILSLNEVEIANKEVPASSAMGQSITFIKHVLMNHNPSYIRDVLNNIAKHLV